MPIRTFSGHRGSVLQILYSPEGGMLATWSNSDQCLRLWDVATGQERFHFGVDLVPGISFSFDAQKLTLSYQRGGVEIRSTASGKVLPSIDSTGRLGRNSPVVYSPRGVARHGRDGC